MAHGRRKHYEHPNEIADMIQHLKAVSSANRAYETGSYTAVRRRLDLALTSARIIHASYNMLFSECAFWVSESKAAGEFFARAQKAMEAGPGWLATSKLSSYAQRLQEMKDRLSLNIERFALLKDFEEACSKARENVLEAKKFTDHYDKQYSGSERWRAATKLLRESLGEALRVLNFREGRYLKCYLYHPISELQRLTDTIRAESIVQSGERTRLEGPAARDAFYALRDPARMFGALEREIEATQYTLERSEAKYGELCRDNEFWRTGIGELRSGLVDAIGAHEKGKTADLAGAERSTLRALHEKIRELAESLAAERKKFEVRAVRNVFGLLAEREKASALLESELSGFEEVLFSLDHRFREGYSWALERMRLQNILNKTQQMMGMAQADEGLTRNQLISEVLRLKSRTAFIRREKERLLSLAGQEVPVVRGPKEPSVPKPAVHRDELSDLLSGLSRKVDNFASEAETLRAAFAMIDELREKFNVAATTPFPKANRSQTFASARPQDKWDFQSMGEKP